MDKKTHKLVLLLCLAFLVLGLLLGFLMTYNAQAAAPETPTEDGLFWSSYSCLWSRHATVSWVNPPDVVLPFNDETPGTMWILDNNTHIIMERIPWTYLGEVEPGVYSWVGFYYEPTFEYILDGFVNGATGSYGPGRFYPPCPPNEPLRLFLPIVFFR